MDDREYMNADYEVISMVNRGRGSGGQLPSAALTFIPAERADHVEALDHRIQQLQKAMPLILAGACLLLGLLLGGAM